MSKTDPTGLSLGKLFPEDAGEGDLVEQVVELALSASPGDELASQLEALDTDGLKVVVFGGGTGMSNMVGGDSRHPSWPDAPFHGLKKIFPRTKAVVCITDDGGSTGELLKDLDLIAIGDLRHVLLSSVSARGLNEKYGLKEDECRVVAEVLHRLFNYRFVSAPDNLDNLLKDAGIDLARTPAAMATGIHRLLSMLFEKDDLRRLLQRQHCLGNLLLVAAILDQSEDDTVLARHAVIGALSNLADILGAGEEAVLPCSTIAAHLKLLYSNGVMVSGEYKAGHARRGCPVERVFVHSHGQPMVPAEVLKNIGEADIIIFAPGSLYTSIIPILQLPEITEEVRGNKRALKLLVSNLWVQEGETDMVASASGRRFHVSDLIRSYHRNIPGGINGLFHEVMVLGLDDIPGSILQSYALEGKVPIYLDREQVAELGLWPIECKIFSTSALEEKRVVQHDPETMARAVRAIWAVREQLAPSSDLVLPPEDLSPAVRVDSPDQVPVRRLAALEALFENLKIDQQLQKRLIDILWRHSDIRPELLANLAGVTLVDSTAWSRSQEWDRIFSFYDPHDRMIKIRQDIFADHDRFELAFLVALGESLLGKYVADKEMQNLGSDSGILGRVYRIRLREVAERGCYLDEESLDEYLQLARMCPSANDDHIYTRLLNGEEGFTPPGLLFGLVFAWYLDNRFAAHIEYKMAILRMEVPDMIPEQVKVSSRRRRLVDFFRRRVFGYDE
jgi:uncharacterized cofD-like protein